MKYTFVGVELSENEKIAEAKQAKQEIHHKNTRLPPKNEYQHSLNKQIFNQVFGK